MSSNQWKECKLGEIVVFQRGHDLTVTNIKPGPYPVAGSNGPIGYHNEFTTKGPSLTLGRSGNSIGVAHFYENNFWAHNTTLYAKQFNGTDPKFVYYLLKTIDFSGHNSGSAVPSLNRNLINPYPLQIPSLPIQKKIASILSSLDDKIELNRQTNQTLEAIAQALFKEWFVDFKFPGASGEMQESELGEIPKGWNVVLFEDELDAVRGLSYKGVGLVQANATPMHNLNSVYEGGGYKTNGIKYYTGEYKEKHVIKSGELIIANTEQGHKYMLIGYPAIVSSFYGDKGIFSHHIYRVRAKEHSYLTSEFMYHLLLQPHVREQVIGFANGTTVNMLKIEGLQKPKFVMPSKELVEKFTAIAKASRQKTEQIIEENRTIADLRNTLLPKLMKGELL